MILGRLNVDLLRWASFREVRFSGKPLPCLWADKVSCCCPSWVSGAWELSGRSGPGGPGHPLWLIITAPGPFHYAGDEVAIAFIKFHFTQLENRHYQEKGGVCGPTSWGWSHSHRAKEFGFSVLVCFSILFPGHHYQIGKWSINQELAEIFQPHIVFGLSTCDPESLDLTNFSWKDSILKIHWVLFTKTWWGGSVMIFILHIRKVKGK